MKLLAGIVALAILLALSGAVYQFTGTWLDKRRFPQEGRSVQVGDHVRLNINCSGHSAAGNPTVVLDSGMGIPALGWTNVQSGIAQFARVCSYDRAGYGWSDTGPEPRTSLQIAKELKALLIADGQQGPFVLVGHSFGGFNVRVYTHLYPTDVLGVVLVDGAHEDEDTQINALLPPAVVEKENRRDLWNARLDFIVRPARVRLGVERLQVATGLGNPSYGVLSDSSRTFSRTFRQELLYLRQQQKFQEGVTSESNAFEESKAEVRAAGNLGDRPLIVLTAGRPYPPDSLLTKEEMEQQDNLWINVLQAQETHLSSRGKQVIVSDSSHMIPFERPETVVNAVQEVYAQVSHR
jgi:pimeloyl-ACP methyl ester carboxylesterase